MVLLKQKQGAGVIAPDDDRFRPAMVAVGDVWEELGLEPTLTSGKDGEHSAGSLHYYGLAGDFRIRDMNHDQIAWAVVELKERLGGDFDVVLERTHIHIEYDPKG